MSRSSDAIEACPTCDEHGWAVSPMTGARGACGHRRPSAAAVVEAVRPLEEHAGHEHGQTEKQVVELVAGRSHSATVALADKVARARAVRRAAGRPESLDDTATIARLAGLLS